MSLARIEDPDHPRKTRATCDGCGTWTDYDHDGPGARPEQWAKWSPSEAAARDYCPRCATLLSASIDHLDDVLAGVFKAKGGAA